MRSLIVSFLTFVLFLTSFAMIAPNARAFSVNSACPGQGQQGSSSAFCTETANGGSNKIYGKGSLLLTAVNILSLVTGIAAVIVIIIAGLNFVTAGGDSNKVNKARDMIIYASVGIVTVLLAQAIVRFVIERV